MLYIRTIVKVCTFEDNPQSLFTLNNNVTQMAQKYYRLKYNNKVPKRKR